MNLEELKNEVSEWSELIEKKTFKYSYLPFEIDTLKVEIHNALWCPDCEREVSDLVAFLDSINLGNLELSYYDYPDKEEYKKKKSEGILPIPCLPVIKINVGGVELEILENSPPDFKSYVLSNILPIYGPAAGRNQSEILKVLKSYVNPNDTVFEIGSGTGQQAAFFSKNLKLKSWICSDTKSNHEVIKLWNSKNLSFAGVREYMAGHCRELEKADLYFTVNSLHIMSEENLNDLLKDLNHVASEGSYFIFYGPFKYEGDFKVESNRNFDFKLRENGYSCIKDYSVIESYLVETNWKCERKELMPKNNELYIFKKLS